jgi:Flp pilus assembly protein TadD
MLAFGRTAAALLLTALWCAPASGARADGLADRFQSALAHYNSRQYAAAQQELESLQRDSPHNFDVEELLGLVYSAEGLDEKATPRFQEAVRLKPDSGPARNNLAMNLAGLGKAQLAEAELKKVVELEPASFDANHNLGEPPRFRTWKPLRRPSRTRMTTDTTWPWRTKRRGACAKPASRFETC